MSRALGINCCLVVVFSLGGASSSLHAQPADDNRAAIETVVAEWKQRFDRYKSVRYSISGTTEKKDLPKGSKVPPVRPVKFDLLLDLVRHRVRIEHNGSGFAATGDRYIPRVSVSVFDKKSLQSNIDRTLCELGPTNADIAIVRGSQNHSPIDNELLPLLCAHGIVPTVPKPARVDRLPTRHTAEEFDNRGDVNHSGSRCLVLRTDPAASKPFLVDEFWIDPAKESAIVRHVYFGGSNPWFRYDTVYQNSDRGWLPASWTFAHTIGGRLIEVSRFTVDRVELDPRVTDSDFALPIPAGSIVSVQSFPEAGQGVDPNKPANGIYRVNSAGKWIPLEETGFTTGDGRLLAPESPGRVWMWWGVAALVGLVAATTVVVLYRRRMRRFTKS